MEGQDWRLLALLKSTRASESERGQSLAELALILPLILVVLLGLMDFTWALRSYLSITNASREGARFASLGATDTAIQQATLESSGGLVSADDVSVAPATRSMGHDVSVTVEYDHNFVTPLGRLLSVFTKGTVPDPLPMKATTTMRVQQ